jgi:hypothetical protein
LSKSYAFIALGISKKQSMFNHRAQSFKVPRHNMRGTNIIWTAPVWPALPRHHERFRVWIQSDFGALLCGHFFTEKSIIVPDIPFICPAATWPPTTNTEIGPPSEKIMAFPTTYLFPYCHDAHTPLKNPIKSHIATNKANFISFPPLRILRPPAALPHIAHQFIMVELQFRFIGLPPALTFPFDPLLFVEP